MNAPIPLSQWIRMVRPLAAQGVLLSMLTGYFDDSGTHGPSKVVVWAGFIAPEARWLMLDQGWRAILAREGLNDFHMADCTAREKEFERRNRADCDKIIHDLREVIMAAELFGIGTAVPKDDWDEVVAENPLGPNMGTAEEFAFSACFYHALNSAQDFKPETDVSLVFDDRDHVTVPMSRIISHYKKQASKSPNLVGVSFQKCDRFAGLQAADMLAWETYKHALNWIEAGRRQPARPHFQDFLTYGRLRGSFMNKDRIRAQFANAVVRTD